MNPLVDLSPSPPTPFAQDFCADLDYKPDGCHVVSSSQSFSFVSFDPPDFGVLCSSNPDSTFGVHEDQVLDEFGAKQPTCAIIFNEYVWDFE